MSLETLQDTNKSSSEYHTYPERKIRETEIGEKFYEHNREGAAVQHKEKYQGSVCVPNKGKLFLKTQNWCHWWTDEVYVAKKKKRSACVFIERQGIMM